MIKIFPIHIFAKKNKYQNYIIFKTFVLLGGGEEVIFFLYSKEQYLTEKQLRSNISCFYSKINTSLYVTIIVSKCND